MEKMDISSSPKGIDWDKKEELMDLPVLSSNRRSPITKQSLLNSMSKIYKKKITMKDLNRSDKEIIQNIIENDRLNRQKQETLLKQLQIVGKKRKAVTSPRSRSRSRTRSRSRSRGRSHSRSKKPKHFHQPYDTKPVNPIRQPIQASKSTRKVRQASPPIPVSKKNTKKINTRFGSNAFISKLVGSLENLKI